MVWQRSRVAVEYNIAIYFLQIQAARNGSTLHGIRQLIVFGMCPQTVLAARELRQMRAVLRDQQIFAETRNGFVVGKLVATVERFRRG